MAEPAIADLAQERDRAQRRRPRRRDTSSRGHGTTPDRFAAAPSRRASLPTFGPGEWGQARRERGRHIARAHRCRRQAKGLAMSLIIFRCPSCGKSSLAFTRPAEAARCARCRRPLDRRQEARADEKEIRERLYAPRSSLRKPWASENG